jgi:acyl-homoserine-lactone acylase
MKKNMTRLNTLSSKAILIVLIFLLTVSCSQENAQDLKTEILWDNYGVPHIYGKNIREMYYAFGWAQMHNHADLILKLYGQARGRAAEYWGEEYLISDKKILLFKVPEQAEKNYKQQDPEYKAYLDAFVQGINEYAKAHPEAIAEDVKQVLPVSVYDVISHTIRITYLEFLAAEDITIANKSSDVGSNSYAIAPSKSTSKNAMLVSNGHLPWSDFFLWFEAHLKTDGFNAYGVALVGIPSITMAFNENLGWTHTVNPIDASDRYELTLKDGGYILDGKILQFDNKTVSIKVKQKDSSLQEQKIEFHYSKHGPVVGQNDKKAYAVRIAGFENFRIFEQYHKMAASRNFDEFETAIKMMQNPMFNIIYADKTGNIFYLFNGNVPIRKTGDFAFWRGTIDGTKSDLIWEQTHPYKDLPKVFNPPSGFVQNCNDPPWTCTDPMVLDPSKYPAYMAPRGTFLRPQRAVNMIKNDPSISFEELVNYKLNTGMEAAERFLDDLLAAVSKYPDSTALKAADVLKTWDKKTEVNSRGAILFAAWWDKVRGEMFAIPWSEKDPENTPDGLKDQKLAVEMLVKAANEVHQKYGSLDIAWGDVYRFRMNGLDYPANGGSGEYGIFRTIYSAEDKDNKKFAVAGETYVAITEFGEKVKAMVLLSYGNSTQTGSKHIGDQLQMLSEKKLRPALLDKVEIMENLEERELLKPNN